MSNTFHFEQIGWKGLLIEADPELADRCRKARPASTVVHCAVVSPDSPASVTFEIAEDNKGLSSISLTEQGLQMLESWTGRRSIRTITVPAKTLDAILTETGVTTI